MKQNYFPSTTLLRLFLALEVVVMHTGLPLGVPISPVACFVCLSGFLIPESFAASRNWGHFAWKRVLRVMPGFLASLVLVAALFGPRVLPATLVCYLTMGLIRAGTANGPLWSLMLEEVLYAWHGLTRSLIKNLPAISIGSLVVISIAWWWISDFPCSDPEGWGKWFVPASCFFVGNLLRYFIDRIERGPVIITLGLAWFLCGSISTAIGFYPAIGSIFGCAFAVGICYLLPQPSRSIPDFSYGVYIYHAPILALLASHGIATHSWGALASAVPGALALAAASWYLIEKPALRLKDFRLRDRMPSTGIVNVQVEHACR